MLTGIEILMADEPTADEPVEPGKQDVEDNRYEFGDEDDEDEDDDFGDDDDWDDDDDDDDEDEEESEE